MSLFKKIFQSYSNSQSNNNQKQVDRLQDLFLINLESIPDETFSDLNGFHNSVGEFIQRKHKRLDYKECGIYDIIEIYIYQSGEKKILFKTYDLDKYKPESFKWIIDSLYSLNGSDTFGNGTFNSKDASRFYSYEFDVLFGRMWDTPEFNYKVNLNINRKDNFAELVVSIIN